ncbi:MAG TPA: DNA polymerase III subunit beta [Anaerolineae bacterium]|nr:DNA polymerase III subunit beta [Anaerolineae bacterium]
MKVSCLQENLAKGLSIVSRAVAARSTLPVLGNILLATDDSRLKLSATNLEIGITCWIGAKVEEDGATTVPARTFVDLVNALPQDRVDMELAIKTQTLNVICGRFANNVKGVDAQEFPIIPTPDEHNSIHIAPDILRKMIEQVVFAAATDEARPILTGVLAKFSGKSLTFAAADGFRLSVRTAQLEDGVDEPLEVIIPARALAELGRILGDQTDPISMTVTPQRSQILFHLSNIDLVSQLIEGKFPDYNAIVPKSTATKSIVDTGLLLKACKAANVFAREAANIAKVTITPGDQLTPGHITIGAQSAETGDNAGELDASIDGTPIEIAFNVKYLIDVLNVVGTDRISLETVDPSKPGLIRPIGDETFTHVIMPMHIGGR